MYIYIYIYIYFFCYFFLWSPVFFFLYFEKEEEHKRSHFSKIRPGRSRRPLLVALTLPTLPTRKRDIPKIDLLVVKKTRNINDHSSLKLDLTNRGDPFSCPHPTAHPCPPDGPLLWRRFGRKRTFS